MSSNWYIANMSNALASNFKWKIGTRASAGGRHIEYLVGNVA